MIRTYEPYDFQGVGDGVVQRLLVSQPAKSMVVNILKATIRRRIKENNCISTYKLDDSTAHSRKVSICKISSVTTAKLEFIPAIVSRNKLFTSREVDIAH